MHDNSCLLFNKYALQYFRPGMRVLEIGGTIQDSAYHKLVSHVVLSWETIDIRRSPGVTHVAAGEYQYPLANESFDIIVAGQVLEHIRHPWKWFKELARLLRGGGHLITISPVSWPYHEGPVDCWRIFPSGLHALCEESDLHPVLCTFESIEAFKYMRTIPGRGRVAESRRSILKYACYRLLSLAGYRVEVAWDAILIARKPPTVDQGETRS